MAGSINLARKWIVFWLVPLGPRTTLGSNSRLFLPWKRGMSRLPHSIETARRTVLSRPSGKAARDSKKAVDTFFGERRVYVSPEQRGGVWAQALAGVHGESVRRLCHHTAGVMTKTNKL